MPQTFLDKGQHIVWFKEADIPADLDAISVATDMSWCACCSLVSRSARRRVS